jgi:hypothetical protein
MMRFNKLVFLAFFLVLPSAYGDESSELLNRAADADFATIVESIDEAAIEQVATGKIAAIDLVGRTATIGGYIYYFGSSTIASPVEVELLGRDFGALQMLTPGMDVEAYYYEAGDFGRVGTRLIQIEAALEH